jgi:SAM-dependent methyltransferase
MDWAKDFYSTQYELLESPAVWATFSPSAPPGRARRRAAAVERLAGPGTKRVLELGCGSGVVAGAIALLGHTVVAVDIVEVCAASARRVAAQVPNGEIIVVQGDFYEIELSGSFDVVCYFDGFGTGSDADQRRLLRRIAAWLKPEGCALIDIYSPWYWTVDDEKEYHEGNVVGRCDFDAYECRLEDSIWPVGADESQAVTQSLRCYSPADLRLLIEGTGLALREIEPYESEDHDKRVPLTEALFYLAKLVPEATGSRE